MYNYVCLNIEDPLHATRANFLDDILLACPPCLNFPKLGCPPPTAENQWCCSYRLGGPAFRFWGLRQLLGKFGSLRSLVGSISRILLIVLWVWVPPWNQFYPPMVVFDPYRFSSKDSKRLELLLFFCRIARCFFGSGMDGSIFGLRLVLWWRMGTKIVMLGRRNLQLQ